jgi:hypothetical protein
MGMLFAFTGKEREISQFDELVTAAGMRTVRAIPVQDPYHVIEVAAD